MRWLVLFMTFLSTCCASVATAESPAAPIAVVQIEPFTVSLTTIQLVGKIDELSAKPALDALARLPAGATVDIYLQGYSHDPDVSVALVDAIASKNARCYAVNAIGFAWPIFQACKTRLISPDFFGTIGSHIFLSIIEPASPEQVHRAADGAQALQDRLAGPAAARMKMTKEEYLQPHKIDSQAKVYMVNGADATTDLKCASDTWHQTMRLVYDLDRPVPVVLSVCPSPREMIAPDPTKVPTEVLNTFGIMFDNGRKL